MKGKLTIDEEEFFDNLDRLIAHYKRDADGLSTNLREPLVKRGGQEFKLEAKRGLNEWEIAAKELTRDVLVGSGQFGDVFEGTYRGEKVAIKTLKETGEAETEEFLAEAHLMTKMKHKNLVQLRGVVTSTDPVMMVAEFMSKVCSFASALPSVAWEHVSCLSDVSSVVLTLTVLVLVHASRRAICLTFCDRVAGVQSHQRCSWGGPKTSTTQWPTSRR
jgi:hypothetical protein